MEVNFAVYGEYFAVSTRPSPKSNVAYSRLDVNLTRGGLLAGRLLPPSGESSPSGKLDR